MSIFKRVPIGDLVHIKGGKRLPLGEEFSTAPTSHPYIRARDIGGGLIKIQDAVFLSDKVAERLWRYKANKGDVCITIVGANVGAMGVVPPELHEANLTENAVRLTSNGRIAQEYLKYALLSDDALAQMKVLAGGAAQPKLGIYKIETIEIPLPPSLTTQRKIAGILSAYDELIETNTRRIANLESMAHAIYRHWFVEFRFPGHEKVKLVDSSIGKIPVDWIAKSIGSLLEFHIGGGWGQDKADSESANPAFVIRGTDIPEARSLGVTNCPLRYHTDSNVRSRKLIANDLVFEVSGGSKGQPVGRCLFVSDRLLRCFDGDVICASFCKLIRVNPTLLAPELLYHYLLQSYTDGTIEQYEVQSTGIKNFKFTVFLESECLALPPADIQAVFVSHVRPLLDAAHVLGKKIEVLRNTRDLLLPKLISGQVDVEDLDIDFGEPLAEAGT